MVADIPTVLLAVVCVLLVAQGGWLWRASRMAGALQRYEQRLDHLADALGLLTEATETGLRAVASEVERMRETGRARPGRPVNGARLAAAASGGRSHAEIAAAEGLSEGEVALRVHLAGPSREPGPDGRRPRARRENAHGTLRAK